ncbi:hypothetical protein HYV22_00710, partial [Candidatus Gottesmanbacteria bacterium]|nr:hypothetical protein [Candidatus Gottesmanbacteria bacterium]
ASTWQQVSVVYDGTQGTGNDTKVKVYVNGVLKSCTVTGTIPGTLTTGTTSNLKLGQGDDATPTSLIGFMDDVKIYNSALTVDQVRLDYNAGASLNFGTGAASESAQLSDGPGNPPDLYWNFDEKSGTSANDKSCNGRTGTFGGAINPAWSQGKVGSSLFFVANTSTTGSRVTYSTVYNPLGTTTGNAMTFETWFKPNATQTNGNAFFVRNGIGTDMNFGVALITLSGGLYKLRLQYYDGTTFRNLDTTNNVVAAGQWNHVVAVITQGTNVSFYINGQFIETKAWSGSNSVASTSSFNIGSHIGSTAQSYDGYIDDVKVYNYARTAAQIAYDYNRGAPVGWWKFDECQGGTANDSSGNNNTGTITIGGTGTQTAIGTCNTSGTAWGNGATGKFNASLNFDGTDDYVQITDTTNLRFDANTLDFSLFAWIKRSANGEANIISKEDADNDGWRLQFNSSNQVVCSEDTTDVTSSSTITDTSWHLVGCTIDRDGNGQVYIDAKADGSSVSMGTDAMATTSNIRLGTRSYTSANYFTGQIDHVRIYNYALSANQVKTVYDGGAAVRYGPATGAP